MRYILVTGPQGQCQLYATADTHPLKPFADLVAPMGLSLIEFAAPTGLLSLPALIGAAALELGAQPDAEPPPDSLAAAVDAARRALVQAGQRAETRAALLDDALTGSAGGARRRPIAGGIADRVFGHARAEVARTREDLGDAIPEATTDVTPRRAAAPPTPPPVEDEGEGDAPFSSPLRAGRLEAPPKRLLDLGAGGNSTVIEVGRDGEAYEVPGWRPTQLQGHPVERAPGAAKRITENR